MDTERLLKILIDIEEDEKSLAISSIITKIRASLAKNNQEGYQEASGIISTFMQEEQDSVVYNFSRTENILLANIGGSQFFGQNLVEAIEEINSSRGFELLNKIDTFISKRNEFIAKSQKLKNDLSELGIKEYRTDQYEVGIVLPSEIGTTDNVYKSIKDFELLISAIQELVLGKRGEIKITRLNNSSLDFFVSQPFIVAVEITTLLSNLIVVWDRIANLNNKITETDGQGDLGEEAKAEIKKILKKEIEKAKKEIIESIPEEILKQKNMTDQGRKNELATQIRVALKAVFKWFELGVEVDIIPVRVGREVKVETPENLEPEKENEYKEQVNLLFKKTNHSIQNFYKIPLDLRKLPFQLESGEEK